MQDLRVGPARAAVFACVDSGVAGLSWLVLGNSLQMQLTFQVQLGLANQIPVLCSLRLGFGKETQADLGCRKVEPGGWERCFTQC